MTDTASISQWSSSAPKNCRTGEKSTPSANSNGFLSEKPFVATGAV